MSLRSQCLAAIEGAERGYLAVHSTALGDLRSAVDQCNGAAMRKLIDKIEPPEDEEERCNGDGWREVECPECDGTGDVVVGCDGCSQCRALREPE